MLRFFLFAVIARALIPLLLLLRVKNKCHLPTQGPLVIVANHNSHLDTAVLTTLLPVGALARVRPAAAADFFLESGRLRRWFAERVLRIIPIERAGPGTPKEKLAACAEALARGDIIFLFPEGTRGEPEVLARFKSGVAHLAELCPDVPIVPVALRGLGRVLPKGCVVPRLTACDALVGEARRFCGDRAVFLAAIERDVSALLDEHEPRSLAEVVNAHG